MSCKWCLWRAHKERGSLRRAVHKLSVFRWLEKRVVRGLCGDMPGHRCPGVPGINITTKTLVNQHFHGKPVLWAAKAFPTLRGLWLAVSSRKKQAFQPQPHLCLSE